MAPSAKTSENAPPEGCLDNRFGAFLIGSFLRAWHNSRNSAATSAAQGLPVQISRSRIVFLQNRRRIKGLPTLSNSIPSVSLPTRIWVCDRTVHLQALWAHFRKPVWHSVSPMLVEEVTYWGSTRPE